MNDTEKEALLIHLLTVYDRKQSTKRFHNPYALGHYFGAVENVVAGVKAGKTWLEALPLGFERCRDGSYYLSPVRQFVKRIS